MRKLVAVTLLSLVWIGVQASDNDSLRSFSIDGVQVAAVKMGRPLRSDAVSSTTVYGPRVERTGISSLTDISAIAPNFHIPDYGSRMTSSIYVRGLGARMDNPVVGLYVDGVPYLNKNNFDFNFYDIGRIEVLRGPQGTLFGRNSMAGTVNIRTLSPLDFHGTRFALEYGSGRTFSARVSYYARLSEHVGMSLGGYYAHSDGFYTNEYTSQRCDDSDDNGLRIRLDYRRRNTKITATATADHLRQGGFPYSPFDTATGRHGSIAYNDPCSYRRDNATAGLEVEHRLEKIAISNTLGYQFTDDKMLLDQDFTPRSMFTLAQAQREHAVTEEAVIRSSSRSRYQWLAGVFAMYRSLNTSAPVTFKRDGIKDLIEDNINRGIRSMFPSDSIDIEQERFDISSRFSNPSAGAALFHTSTVRLLDGRLELCAGVRLDYEYSRLRYDSRTSIDYRFTYTMADYKSLETLLRGRTSLSYFEVLPKFTVLYSLGGAAGNVFLSAAKGYRAGGFNIQMFSDILQNRMRDDMMSDLGLHMGGEAPYDVRDIMSYRPEYCWNYEAGAHLNLIDGTLRIDASAFYIDCRDQQITVFPAGTTTGRMMRNAGRTRSAGAELAVDAYPCRGLRLAVSYGYTNAKFVDYHDGKRNYNGNHVPYAPQNTFDVSAEYRMEFSSVIDAVMLRVGYKGAGKIYWDDANTASQPFYGLLAAGLTIEKGAAEIDLWGRNLTGTRYDTFFFQSVGNCFVQRGKPAAVGITVRFSFSGTK